MRKVPPPTHEASPWPPVSDQLPTAIPLLSVPTVPGDPFDVPVSPPSGAVSVRTLPFVADVTVKFRLPDTVFV